MTNSVKRGWACYGKPLRKPVVASQGNRVLELQALSDRFPTAPTTLVAAMQVLKSLKNRQIGRSLWSQPTVLQGLKPRMLLSCATGGSKPSYCGTLTEGSGSPRHSSITIRNLFSAPSWR
jgi:hypothetical protein